MKAVVAAFNQEKALVGAFSVITNLRMELFQALVASVALGSRMNTLSNDEGGHFNGKVKLHLSNQHNSVIDRLNNSLEIIKVSISAFIHH